MTAVATQFGYYTNRGSASSPGGGGSKGQDVVYSNADDRFILPRWMLSGRPEISRSWLEFGGEHYDWLTIPQHAPTIALNTADATSFGGDTTPTLEFTGTDADGDDVSYEIQISSDSGFGGSVTADSNSESNYNASFDTVLDSGDSLGVAQAFTGNGGALTGATFYLKKTGAPTGNAAAKLYATTGTYGTEATPTGSALATSDNFDVSTLTTSFALIAFTFSGANQFQMVSGTHYCISVEYSGGDSFANFVTAGLTDDFHSGNSSNSLDGTTWSSHATDLVFYVTSATPILDKFSSTDAGFLNTISGGDTDPFTSGQKVSFTVQAGDALTAGTWYWRARGSDPLGSTSWGDWATARSFSIGGGTLNTSSLSGSLSFVGAQTKLTSKSFAGSLGSSGTIARRTAHLIAATLSFIGATVKLTARSLPGAALSFVGSLVGAHLFIKALTAALSFSGSMTRQTNKTLTGVLSFIGAITRRTAKVFSGALSFAGNLTKRSTRAFTAALSFTGSIAKQTARAFSGALSFSGALASVKTTVQHFVQAFTASLTFAGAISRQTNKPLTASLSFAGNIGKAIAKGLQSVLGFIGALLGVKFRDEVMELRIIASLAMDLNFEADVAVGLNYSDVSTGFDVTTLAANEMIITVSP